MVLAQCKCGGVIEETYKHVCEDYPGQNYYWKHSPNIKRAEAKFYADIISTEGNMKVKKIKQIKLLTRDQVEKAFLAQVAGLRKIRGFVDLDVKVTVRIQDADPNKAISLQSQARGIIWLTILLPVAQKALNSPVFRMFLMKNGSSHLASQKKKNPQRRNL